MLSYFIPLTSHVLFVGTPAAFRLEEAGYGMGLRVLELQTFRERLQKRRVRLLPMLQWVSSNVWKASWWPPGIHWAVIRAVDRLCLLFVMFSQRVVPFANSHG